MNSLTSSPFSQLSLSVRNQLFYEFNLNRSSLEEALGKNWIHLRNDPDLLHELRKKIFGGKVCTVFSPTYDEVKARAQSIVCASKSNTILKVDKRVFCNLPQLQCSTHLPSPNTIYRLRKLLKSQAKVILWATIKNKIGYLFPQYFRRTINIYFIILSTTS